MSVSTFLPLGNSRGLEITIGMWIDSWYDWCHFSCMSPCALSSSPWSDQNTTIVSSKNRECRRAL